MMNINKLFLLLLPAIFVVGGCYQIVHVTDPAGEPVAGARVITKYSAAQGGGIDQTAETNRWGDAWLTIYDTSDPPVEVWVKCQGYFTTSVTYRLDNKINVVIKPLTPQ